MGRGFFGALVVLVLICIFVCCCYPGRPLAPLSKIQTSLFLSLSSRLLAVQAMLSSRPQHQLFVDKENTLGHVSHSQTTSRKGAARYTSAQASAYLAVKTPGVKQQQAHAKTASKAGNGDGTGKVAEKEGAQTIAMEPGARILGAKDGNNRQRGPQTAKTDKQKGRQGQSSQCADIGELAD